jgi:hypothetical protein
VSREGGCWQSVEPLSRRPVSSSAANGRCLTLRSVLFLAVLLAAFGLLQWRLPLGSAVKIGADEGFELAKATLCLSGHRLYSEIWNDQPPLHVFLLTRLIDTEAPSILAPRLLTVGLAGGLLVAVFVLGLRFHGPLAGGLAALWVMGSPGFLELSCSVMQEVPALAPAVGALAVLSLPGRPNLAVVGSGLLFAVALQMKLIGVIYLPLAGMLLWLRFRSAEGDAGSLGWLRSACPPGLLGALGLFGASLMLGFALLLVLTGEAGSYLAQLTQSWAAHFAPPQSLEYGSPRDHPFDWSVLVRNWDATVPALLGCGYALARARRDPRLWVPAAWLVWVLVVFGLHRPWWTYYYVHTAVGLGLCAGLGLAAGIREVRARRRLIPGAVLGLLMVGAGGWLIARLHLQVQDIGQLPRSESSLVLAEIQGLEEHTRFLFTDDPIYSFHAGIPLPPKLGVISLKRFWSGDLTNEGLAAEVAAARPELVLLRTETEEPPFAALLTQEYRLIYFDARHRLYGRRSMLKEANW